MPAAAQLLDFDSLPPEGAFLVPGRLDYPELVTLVERLEGRRITWLAEEGSFVDAQTRDYLGREDVTAATFDENDPSPRIVGEHLEAKMADGGLLIFIPSEAAVRPGSPCHISSRQLRFLCDLGLPMIPLAVHLPRETSLAIERTAGLPSAVMALGEPIAAGEASVAVYRERLLAAFERAFSSRAFLRGSLAAALVAGLKKWGSSRALFDGADDTSISFAKLLAAAIAFSKEIRKATDRKRVGVLLPPGKAGLVANLAVLFANKVPVNLNFTASRDAVESSIRQADLDKFITADPFVRKVASFPWPPTRDLIFIERTLPIIRRRIIKWVILSRLLPTPVLTRLLGLGKSGRDHDEAVLLFTSGSAGEPKGVPLSHRNLLANVCQFGTRLALPPGAGVLGSLPLFHSFGCTVTLWYPIIEGIDLVTYPSPLEPKRLAELVAQHKIRLLLATPTFLRGYMRRVDPELLESLDLVVTGAEKLPESLARAFEDKFGLLPLEGYGLTETSPATNVNLPDPPSAEERMPVIRSHHFGSVGAFLPGIAIRITNPATEQPATIDQSGVIWLKGANIFSGYLDRPDLTEAVITDGWFNTGDIGRMDDDGFLYIEGRISRFSKIAGEMVPHETVEAAVNKALGLDNEAERKIAVVGMPDEKKGEAIAVLSCISTTTLQQEVVDLRYKLMDAGIPSLWCPREIIPVDEIPVLASGKLDIKACEALAKRP